MKKKITIVIMAFVMIFVAVNFSYAEETTRTLICNEIAKISKTIMTVRQNGMPLITIIERVRKVNEENDVSQNIKDVILEIVKDAYNQPRFSTEEYQQRAIIEFQNKWYLGCLTTKSMTDGDQ